jgi:hypothetical protein
LGTAGFLLSLASEIDAENDGPRPSPAESAIVLLCGAPVNENGPSPAAGIGGGAARRSRRGDQLPVTAPMQRSFS